MWLHCARSLSVCPSPLSFVAVLLLLLLSPHAAGLEVPVGEWVSAPAAAAGSAQLHVRSATLLPLNRSVSDTSLGMTQYVLSAREGASNTPVVLCSLSSSRPHTQREIKVSLKDKVAFQLSSIPASSTATYSVQLGGYTAAASAAAAAAPAASAAAAAAPQTPKAQTPKRKAEAAAATTPAKGAAAQAPAAKKARVQEDEDDEDDEDDDAPAPAAASRPQTPTTPKSSKPAIISLKNGLKLQDTKIGSGKEAVDRSAVGIRYRGSLASNGKVFDSNMPRGQPLRFKIGGGDVIAGFEQGTKGMKVGGTRTVVIPAHLGYGARGAPPDIPPNSTLIFDLELVSVK
jgi:FKBP-type peptidyl-prolyl cis-trans isomerase